MKRISNNRDLFEAKPGEVITVTVEASKTPYQVTFSQLASGGQWKSIQAPTPAQPVEKRQFTMPNSSRELFVIVYSFPPASQIDPNAKYLITFAGGGGTTDGPNDVLPPPSGDIDDLPYEFRLPGMQPILPSPSAQGTIATTSGDIVAKEVTPKKAGKKKG